MHFAAFVCGVYGSTETTRTAIAAISDVVERILATSDRAYHISELA
jgi:hypothetical protein